MVGSKERGGGGRPNNNRVIVSGDKIDSPMCGASMAPNKSSKWFYVVAGIAMATDLAAMVTPLAHSGSLIHKRPYKSARFEIFHRATRLMPLSTRKEVEGCEGNRRKRGVRDRPQGVRERERKKERERKWKGWEIRVGGKGRAGGPLEVERVAKVRGGGKKRERAATPHVCVSPRVAMATLRRSLQ